MEISIKDNVKDVVRYLNDVQKKQVPYATSRAMNDALVAAQNDIVAELPRRFTLRKKWWLKQQPTGIKVQFTRKTDLKGAVFTNVYFAEIQEKGGVKTPKSGKNLALPTDAVPKRYRQSRGAREMVAAKAKVFATPKGIFRRRSKKKLEILWSFTRTARIMPRFSFVRIARYSVQRSFPKHFDKWLQKALATAKPPSRP